MTRFGKLQEKMTIEGNKMRWEIDELEEIFSSDGEKTKNHKHCPGNGIFIFTSLKFGKI